MKISSPLIIILFFGTMTITYSCSGIRKQRLGEKLQVYVPADQPLFDTIALQDSLLFTAFNSKDIEKMKQYFSSDLEVYQDNTGLRNYEQTITAFTELFQKEYVLKRELIRNSLEVYPINDYGAIESGRHTFSHTENGKMESATFKFLHIWKKEKEGWKIVRLITYDHK